MRTPASDLTTLASYHARVIVAWYDAAREGRPLVADVQDDVILRRMREIANANPQIFPAR